MRRLLSIPLLFLLALSAGAQVVDRVAATVNGRESLRNSFCLLWRMICATT